VHFIVELRTNRVHSDYIEINKRNVTMKAIINGKRYDTAKATLLAEASSDVGRSDFDWWEEELYRTLRSGAYFLAGQGHARSHYAKSLGGGSWGPGHKISPMTEAEALAWAEKHLTADQIEVIFPGKIEEA
jgi:hypothetical protein